jgi:predicted helicase
LARGHYAEFQGSKIRTSLYRPFAKQHLFFDRILNEEVYVFPRIFPTTTTEQENRVICVSGIGSNKPFHTLIVNYIPCLDILEKTQCFPFYTYDADGTNRRENITDWALAQFRAAYAPHPLPLPVNGEGSLVGADSVGTRHAVSATENDNGREKSRPYDATEDHNGRETRREITKWAIFYYVYAVLHQPEYRAKYAANLKRDLPRLPLVDFWQYADAGRQLAELHLNYETIEPYPLEYQWTAGKPVSYRVEKMRLTKDKTALIVNPSLTLAGIPSGAFAYKLGNRSALDWVIDQYQVKTDKRSGITSDPNLYSEDEQYIVKLVGRVIAVSLQTMALVNGLT